MNGCIHPGKTLQQSTVCLPMKWTDLREFGIAVDFWN